MRDDLLQLKRTEPTNFKKLTALFLFTVRPCRQPPDRVINDFSLKKWTLSNDKNPLAREDGKDGLDANGLKCELLWC